MEANTCHMARRFLQTAVTTTPIRNIPMARLVELPIGRWDDDETEQEAPLSIHEQEAIAALYRYRVMRALRRGLTRLAWHAISVRLSDARMQLTVGLSPAEALATPLVADLLTATLGAGYMRQECGATRPLRQRRTRRTRELVSRGRVQIQIVRF